MDSAVFRNLVRHEFKGKGSWRKQSRSRISRSWWLAYCLIILIAAIGTMTYFAINEQLQINSIWFVTMGFPYMFFFWGYGSVKREWENDTYGWWLTMPYPRTKLITAKWLGIWLKLLIGIVIVFAVLSVYVLILSLVLPAYSLADVGSFMVAGVDWLTLVAGFSPLIIALGILISIVQNSSLRPISPVLWIVFMGGLSLIFQLPDVVISENMIQQGTEQIRAEWFPYAWELPMVMGISWILTYAVLKFSGYLLENKLEL
ncbi:ABC transporter permease subunit [Paenibacillus sp. HJL G12]|uniref:ABC transporter permease subunit n=1 Tax=Paenibacillus dendrobii TaxID=2691084 RepID=A0A7X3ILE6_9BACL|nr:ABC transporter permease subunit [Paenibacillus dendrobii]MWV45760.1 ABC transporter permease subunit [Paenibacillus dendrobii]